MLALKASLFQDLNDPLSYTKTRGFCLGAFAPDHVRAFGTKVYFYQGRLEASCTTPESRVLSSRINQHAIHADHTLSLLLPDDWLAETLQQLKEAMRLVYADDSCLPLSTAASADFETFWSACRKPFRQQVLTLEAPSRRRRDHTFINMFDGLREITGQCTLARGGLVRASVRFSVSEGDQVTEGFGIRAHFGAGIRVLRTSDQIPKIVSPWDWTDVQFPDLTLPLRGPFHVKTPALRVVDTDGATMTMAIKQTEFQSALDDFHHLAGVSVPRPWTVEYTGRAIPQPGSTVLGTVEPSRNNGGITWQTRKVFVRPPRLEIAPQKRAEAISEGAAGMEAGAVRKRDSDTLDNSSGARTKRRYT